MAPAPVLILGRPNVGKSTLFNRLIGQRRSIVGDEPGITRDRIYGEAEWQGRRFDLVDTGGILMGDDAILPSRIFEQVRFALTESAIVLFVVDSRAGVTAADEQLAKHLHKWGGRVLLVANKADSSLWEMHAEEFRRLGFERSFAVSAEQARGLSEMLDALLEELPNEEEGTTGGKSKEIKVAVIGRPNVGKSSLINKLLGSERVIVSPVPGTTRDAVDSMLAHGGHDFRLIDTAGIRKRSHIQAKAERMSVLMAERHLKRADVAVLLLDAVEGPTATDATIAAIGSDAGKSMILAVNKWDLVTKSKGIGSEFEQRVRDRLKFVDYAPIVFISALSGHRVSKLLPLAVKAFEARHLRISTGELNRVFEAVLSDPRAMDVAKALRLHYITQADTDPPTFVVFASARSGKMGESIERYLNHQLRARYEFFATPIRVRLRRR